MSYLLVAIPAAVVGYAVGVIHGRRKAVAELASWFVDAIRKDGML